MRKNIRYYVAVVAIILIVSIAVVMRTDAGEKKIPDNVFKCYTTIEIKEGDTLWKLADRYSDPKYISRSEDKRFKRRYDTFGKLYYGFLLRK